jgi:tetratricopeptide (TPR) repeat protein
VRSEYVPEEVKKMEGNEDEENPLGETWDYGDPLGAEGKEVLEFCPFCEGFVESIDGACIECGHTIPARGEVKRAERRRIKPDPNDPNYCYRKGKELFRGGQPGEEWFRKAVALNPKKYWAYYFLGRELLKKGHLEEAEGYFAKALSGLPTEPWPHYYLAKLLFKRELFTEAENEFKKSLEYYPHLETAKRYIDEIKLRKTKLEFPKTVKEVENLTENVILANHALIEWFEINMRDFVKTVLEKTYGDRMWWRKGIPLKVRKNCAERIEESSEEELDSPELSFMQFYGYVEIINANKPLFKSYFDIKEWTNRLNQLEPIRNGIMHCRGRYLSPERNSTLKSWCHDLEEILKTVNKPLAR